MRAARGVIYSVLTLLEEGVTHLGVATDHVIESFRNDLWPGYKSSAGMPPVLLAQFPLLEEALEALGVTVWPMVELEADDALAAAAATAAADPEVEQVVIMTPDKDLAQCVIGTRVVQLDRRPGHRHRRGRRADQVRRAPGVDPRLAGPGGRLGRRLPRPQGLGQEGRRHRPAPLPPPRGHPRARLAVDVDVRGANSPVGHLQRRSATWPSSSATWPPCGPTPPCSTTSTTSAGPVPPTPTAWRRWPTRLRATAPGREGRRPRPPVTWVAAWTTRCPSAPPSWPSAASEALHAGSEKAVARQHARGKMTARERVEYLLDDGSFNELDLLVRHRATGMGLDGRPALHRRRDHRLGHGRRPPGLPLLPGLHRLRRLAGRGLRREGPQGHGPGRQRGRPPRRPQRRRRGPHPGGRGRRSSATARSSAATPSRRASSPRSA